MPGVNWELSPAIPDLHIPRMEPCSATDIRHDVCGATPASQYRKECGSRLHTADIWLCPIHAAICGLGGGMCRECAKNGGIVQIRLTRLTGPVRL